MRGARIAVITGASSGLGRAFALKQAALGGTSIRIADGADEQAAVDGLIKLVNSGFSE